MQAKPCSLLVYGAGWTGRQIAAQAAGHGLDTTLVDLNLDQTLAAVAWGQSHVRQLIDQGYWQPLAEPLMLQPTSMEDWPSRHFNVIIECVPEQISLKRQVLQTISQKCDNDTIITSNSSYFVPSWLESKVRLPERFAHWHFHVPVWMATVVDIVPCSQTAPHVLLELERLSIAIGQHPIVQRRENSGYLFNAMLQAVLTTALQLAENQIGSWEEIDLAWKKVTQMPLGPFGIMDQIGLDLVLESFQNARWLPNAPNLDPIKAILIPYVEAGHLGVKTGRGFYSYPTPTSSLLTDDPNQETQPDDQNHARNQ